MEKENNSDKSDFSETEIPDLKRVSNNEWCEYSAKAVVGRCSSTILKRDSDTGVFL